MTTVDDFAQGMLREYSAFAGQCAALVAAHGDEEAAAMLYSIDDLPQIAEQLRAFRVRAEAAEARAAQAEAAVCFGCGPVSACDEDRCCATCGRDLIVVADAGSADVLTDAIAAARADSEAAEARAAQAQADARLMAGLAFAGFVARTSFSPVAVEASLLDALEDASDHTATVSDADLVAALRRILATAGAT